MDIHFTPTEMSPYMNVHDRYTYDDLEKIFDETDILVAPSQWYETFGYTVLEALSFGVPVVISGTVGAKDVLAQGAGAVLEDIDSEKLYLFFRELDAGKLRDMNEAIVDKQEIMTINQMVNEIEEQCY